MKHNSGFLKLVNQAKAEVAECDVDFVNQRLQNGDAFFLIDTREDNEWAEGHIPKAIHLGRGVLERDIESRISDLNAEIVLYCGGGFRSALAAQSLQRMGYTNVISMDGGMRSWREKGFLVVKP